MENLRPLTEKELKETEGGILGLIWSAFVVGVAYGYVKEKFASGQWEL
jgi:hypothetical protein